MIPSPIEINQRIASLPRNRHGRRAAAAIAKKYGRQVRGARALYAVRKANRAEDRLTPRERIEDRLGAMIFDAYLEAAGPA